jgi:hypothetical protein
MMKKGIKIAEVRVVVQPTGFNYVPSGEATAAAAFIPEPTHEIRVLVRTSTPDKVFENVQHIPHSDLEPVFDQVFLLAYTEIKKAIEEAEAEDKAGTVNPHPTNVSSGITDFTSPNTVSKKKNKKGGMLEAGLPPPGWPVEPLKLVEYPDGGAAFELYENNPSTKAKKPKGKLSEDVKAALDTHLTYSAALKAACGTKKPKGTLAITLQGTTEDPEAKSKLTWIYDPDTGKSLSSK